MNVLLIAVAMLLSSTLTFACETPKQIQLQGQAQKQSQNAIGVGVGVSTSKSDSTLNYSEQREVLPALPINPQPFPLLNGRIGEMATKRILWMQKCGKDDTLVSVVEVNDGGIFTAIRYKDLNKETLKTTQKYWGDTRKLCYWVGYNESSNGGGIGGGATGALSSGNSFMSTGAAIIPGYNAATFDPKFFIEIDEVIPE